MMMNLIHVLTCVRPRRDLHTLTYHLNCQGRRHVPVQFLELQPAFVCFIQQLHYNIFVRQF